MGATPEIQKKEWLTTAIFAEVCGISGQAIRKAISEGRYKNIQQSTSIKGTLKYKIHYSELPPEALRRFCEDRNRAEIEEIHADEADGFDQKKANEKWEAIAPVIAGETTARERADDLGIPARTFQRWVEAYRKNGTGRKMRALTRKKRRDRGNFRNLEPEIMEAFKKMYLTGEQRKIKTCYYYLSQYFGEKMPSYQTLLRYEQTIPRDIKTRMRHGEKRWRDRHEPIIRRDLNSYAVAEIYVGDHHEFDLLVEHEGRLIRPWLTAWLDVRTGAITGWNINTQPSSETIALALAEAIRIGADGLGGIPSQIYIDNGKDYRCRRLNGTDIRRDSVKKIGSFDFDEASISFFSEFGIKRTFAKPYLARSKGSIERWFRTMEQGFGKFMPGYIASQPKDRPEELQRRVNAFAKGERDFFVTLGDLRAMFEGWLDQHYHRKIHSRLNDTPINVWKKYKGEIRTISEKTLQASLWPRAEATIQQSGVNKFGTKSQPRYYWHEEIPKHVGQKIIVRYNPEDISTLYAYLPDGTYLFPLVHRPFINSGVSERDYKKLVREQASERKRINEQMNRIRSEGAEIDPLLRFKNRDKGLPEDRKEAVLSSAVGAEVIEAIPKYENLKAPADIKPQPAQTIKFFKFQVEENNE